MTPYSKLQHLAAAIFFNGDKQKRYLAVFGHTAYFDGSGSPDEGNILCVGGYVSTVRDWNEFEVDWSKALKWAKVDAFHMKDFVSCRRQFSNKKWERKELRDEFIEKLVRATKRHVDHSMVAMVRLADWRIVNQEYALEESWLTPYALCGRTCVKMVHDWGDRRGIPRKHIEFFFEYGDRHQDHLRKRMQLDHNFEPNFKPKTDIVPFQACDLSAYESHKAEKKVEAGESISINDFRRSFIALLDIPYEHGIFYEADLRAICESAPIQMREERSS